MTSAEIDMLLQMAKSGRLDARAAARLGIAAIEQRREQGSLEAVTAAAEGARTDASLWHVLGLMHRGLDDLEPAIAALDMALTLPNPTPTLLHARAHAAREAGLPSLDWYRRARVAAPGDGDIILGEAAALVGEARGDEADNLLSAMLEAHPGWFAGHTALVKLRHAGNHPNRFEAIDRAIATFPADLRLHQLKIVALLRAEEGDAARAALSHAYAACGRQALLNALGAMVATEFGSLAEGDAAFALCDLESDADVALYHLRHVLRRGEPERVVAQYPGFTGSVPAEVWPYLSAAWRMLGDARSAWLDNPAFVTETHLELDDASIETLASTLRALHHTGGQPIDQSVRGGSQTDGPLFSRVDPAIRAVREKCRNAVAAYIAGLPPGDPAHPLLGKIPAAPRFVGSWSVRLVDEGFHAPHVHTHGWLSSALYVTIPDNPDNSDAGALFLGAPQPSLGMGLEPSRLVRPRPGRLVLFPSTLWHGTRPFPAGERMTIAFDIG